MSLYYVVRVQGISFVCDSYRTETWREPVSFGDGFPEDEPVMRHCELSLNISADSAEEAVKQANEIVQKLLNDETNGLILREPPYERYV